jgi:hypothetical protein
MSYKKQAASAYYYPIQRRMCFEKQHITLNTTQCYKLRV